MSCYVANGAVVLPRFEDPTDGVALRVAAAAWPGREIVQVDALEIVEGGGGVHGNNALEGTFLGGCIFSGLRAGRGMAGTAEPLD